MAIPKNKAAEALKKVNDAEKLARRDMEHQERMWWEALQSYQQKGPVQDPFAVNIKLGRLIADTQTVVTRDAGALLGTAPYFPIRANWKTMQPYADAIEDIASYFSGNDFFVQFVDALTMARPLGLSYIEPQWKTWPVNIYQKAVERDNFGRVVGVTEFMSEDIDEGIRWKTIGPWGVRPHPHGNTLDEKPELCIVELVHINEIERLVDQGTYELEQGVTKKDLKGRKPDDDELYARLRKETSSVGDNLRTDVGVLIRYYSEDRWIHTWNRAVVLMDTENQNKNMPRFKKPIAALRNVTHIGPDRFFPIGMYEYGRDLEKWGDKILSAYFESVMKFGDPMVLYNPDVINRGDLVAQSGQRVPVRGGRFDEAFRSQTFGQPNEQLFDLYNITRENTDMRRGIFDYQRGSSPIRKETATATQQLSNAGDSRMEYGVMYMEQTVMRDLAYLTTKLIDANMTNGQRDKILGPERGQVLLSLDPDSLPGGFQFEFDGSERVARRAQKVETFIQVYNMIRNQPTVQQGAWLLDRKLAEMTEALSAEELDQIGLSQEAVQAMMQPQAPPVSEAQAVQNPNAIATPASNVAVGQMA